MSRFFSSNFPIVRIGNRMYQYSESRKTIWGTDSDLSSMGFKNDGDSFERVIEENEIDSAYRVSMVRGLYRDYTVIVNWYEEDTKEFFVTFESKDGEAVGIKPRIDYFDKNNPYYEAYIPESELPEIYEIRKPQRDFPFESPRIVFHKKDGGWLPFHELGALLEDDEWL